MAYHNKKKKPIKLVSIGSRQMRKWKAVSVVKSLDTKFKTN